MISYEQITKLPAYQDLLSLGFQDISSDTLKRRGNIRLHHPTFGQLSHWQGNVEGPAFVQIYQNGNVRGQSGDRQYRINGLHTDELRTKEDYESKILATRKYMIRRILRDDFGIGQITRQKAIAKDTIAETTIEMLKQVPTLFRKWIADQDETTQAGFLGAEGIETALAAEIQKAPTKYAVILKDLHKTKSIQKAIELLPTEMGKQFSKDIGLLGDLSGLGL